MPAHTARSFKLNTAEQLAGKTPRELIVDSINVPTTGLAEMPAVGLGTWQADVLTGPGSVEEAVAAALKAGYRHIDTAAAYGNEAGVGAGIRKSGVPRDQIWVTTKLDNPHHKRAEAALRDSLDKLFGKGTEGAYIDLYLMHWPSSTKPGTDITEAYHDWDFKKTWAEMQKLFETGMVKNIGVSNFGIKQLKALLAFEGTKIVPAVNQIELHPYNPSPSLVAFNTKLGIHTTGYSCLGGADLQLHENTTLQNAAKAKGKTPQQMLLMWGLQKGWSVIPKSTTPKYIESNFQLDGWDLTADEMATLDSMFNDINKTPRRMCRCEWLPKEDEKTKGTGLALSGKLFKKSYYEECPEAEADEQYIETVQAYEARMAKRTQS